MEDIKWYKNVTDMMGTALNGETCRDWYELQLLLPNVLSQITKKN